MKISVNFLTFCVLSTIIISCGKSVPNHDIAINVIPLPVSIEKGEGNYMLTEDCQIYIHGKNFDIKYAANYFANQISGNTDLEFNMVLGTDRPIDEEGIHFVILDEYDKKIGDEGYYLEIDKSIVIKSNTAAGSFYGVITLLQMFPPEILGYKNKDKFELVLPKVKITDYPGFKYRGAHLDVCRHFFTKKEVKKYIDMMAVHKLNTFHWHLTEDQGWRIEIKKYPKLTEIASKRKETIVGKNFDPYIGDSTVHEGFYTQEDIKEIVEYARERFITVIPEIEMPGHSLAALAAYPELSCTGGPFETGTKWGVFEDIYCAGNDSTFAFLENVLSEVIDLFPSQYIHIGGDEAPKARWDKCPKCQARMKSEGLKDENELQSYFIRRIETFLNSKGKNLIGWDEILEGGLAPNATVMSWRGTEGGIDAARQGHDVIMTPGSHMYFDHYQAYANMEPLAIGGNTSLEKVYSFDPVPKELSEKEAVHILGLQANLWTEYIADVDYLEYMYLPRMSALAEVGWTPKKLRNWDDFSKRMVVQYERYESMGYNYRVPTPVALADTLMIPKGRGLELKSPIEKAVIRYTLDGSEPNEKSIEYTTPIAFSKETTVKSRLFYKGKMSSVVSTLVRLGE